MIADPASTAVTCTEKVQEAPGASAAPDKPMLFDPGAALNVPLGHPPIRPLLGVDMTKKLGSRSLNPMPVREIGFVAGFVIVKLKLVLFGPIT